MREDFSLTFTVDERSMKVLYCYKYGILGGVCTQLINRLSVLQPAGKIDAQIVFFQDLGISKALSDYPYHFENDPAKFRSFVESGGFDLIVVIDTPEYLEALAGFKQAPVITEIHTTTELGLKYLGERNWSTAGYIVPSLYSKNMLRERFGLGEDAPVRIVPNSLDMGLFPRTETASPPLRPIFGWVGKLDDHKDWRTMLKLASRIKSNGVDAEFWIVGGETAPLSVQEELIDRCEDLDLHAHLRWFPRIEYRAMHRLYGAVRDSGGATIVTSINESFGMSVLEALMCGCPVLASEVGALPEIAPGKPYLQFYPLGDVNAAATTATALIEPSEQTSVVGELDKDRDELAARYSTNAVGPQYLTTLTELATRVLA